MLTIPVGKARLAQATRGKLTHKLRTRSNNEKNCEITGPPPPPLHTDRAGSAATIYRVRIVRTPDKLVPLIFQSKAPSARPSYFYILPFRTYSFPAPDRVSRAGRAAYCSVSLTYCCRLAPTQHVCATKTSPLKRYSL